MYQSLYYISEKGAPALLRSPRPAGGDGAQAAASSPYILFFNARFFPVRQFIAPILHNPARAPFSRLWELLRYLFRLARILRVGSKIRFLSLMLLGVISASSSSAI